MTSTPPRAHSIHRQKTKNEQQNSVGFVREFTRYPSPGIKKGMFQSAKIIGDIQQTTYHGRMDVSWSRNAGSTKKATDKKIQYTHTHTHHLTLPSTSRAKASRRALASSGRGQLSLRNATIEAKPCSWYALTLSTSGYRRTPS